MFLVLQFPRQPDASMVSLLYLRLMTLVCVLEATERYSLHLLQTRILLAYYEFGHGLMAAATASIAGCAKIAGFLGLSPRNIVVDNSIETEERRRAWWALHNLDRSVHNPVRRLIRIC
jgi:hypothetical protein